MTIKSTSNKYAVSVLDFGAKGDGISNDSPAIQKALDSASSIIIIPAGKYIIGNTLLVPSGKTVHAHPDAIMRLADGAGKCRNDFLITNSDHAKGNHHITIKGGIWDGNNENNFRGIDGDMQAYTGVAINFVNVDNLTLSDLTVSNPDSFHIRIGEVRHFRIENITFSTSIIRGNQDGIHIGGFSEDGYIYNLRAVTSMTPNDDMVAINADDDIKIAINLGMKLGPIRNIHVEGIFADSVYSFIRILSKDQLIENIRIHNVIGGVRRFAVNMTQWHFPMGSGNIRNIHISNFNIRKIRTEYLADALSECSLIRKDSNMLGYDSAHSPNQMPHISCVASVEYVSEPLFLINLSVSNLVIENFMRMPEDHSGSDTFILKNKKPNRLEFATPLKIQMQKICNKTEGIDDSISGSLMPDGATIYHVAVDIDINAEFLIEQGSIAFLRINRN